MWLQVSAVGLLEPFEAVFLVRVGVNRHVTLEGLLQLFEAVVLVKVGVMVVVVLSLPGDLLLQPVQPVEDLFQSLAGYLWLPPLQSLTDLPPLCGASSRSQRVSCCSGRCGLPPPLPLPRLALSS